MGDVGDVPISISIGDTGKKLSAAAEETAVTELQAGIGVALYVLYLMYPAVLHATSHFKLLGAVESVMAPSTGLSSKTAGVFHEVPLNVA